MDLIHLLVSVSSGALGANIVGLVVTDKDLGVIGNSVIGILGGGIASAFLQFIGLLGPEGLLLDLHTILANVGGSSAGGAILLLLVVIIKKFF